MGTPILWRNWLEDAEHERIEQAVLGACVEEYEQPLSRRYKNSTRKSRAIRTNPNRRYLFLPSSFLFSATITTQTRGLLFSFAELL
jgi:hypothetical protein